MNHIRCCPSKEYRFNRYMVECEFFIFNVYISYTLVLIDTWWNVNWEKDLFVDGFAKVLIDTWWNVNVYIRYCCK